MTETATPHVDKPDRPDLSAREARVALLIGRCLSYQEIADRTGICFETVRSIVARLRRKTGRERKPELAVWASRRSHWLAGLAGQADGSTDLPAAGPPEPL